MVRHKIAFMKSVVTYPRVRCWIKLLLFLVAAYLPTLIYLAPDFLPVIGYLDDVAVVLMVVASIVCFIPTAMVAELMGEASKSGG